MRRLLPQLGKFAADFRAPFVKELAIWGCTIDSFEGEEDLLLRVVKYQSETILVSSVADNHGDCKQCGGFEAPCESLSEGVQHIIPSRYSQLLISEQTIINGECCVQNVSIHSLESTSAALVYLNSTIVGDVGSLITTAGRIRIERAKFTFGQSYAHSSCAAVNGTNGEHSFSFENFASSSAL
ncbi:uncharacterized protein MONOS_3749 [Monocercomonoides exilis]|uniref:uncharacterized protein n=1 Tax=Monocercomonoides exilis TaxID=2049356 RepID=UPI003559C537|nr:hypothetical protein MONOS_3749 [Monocercomonoides exilis]|eukprot:MONOS_3749.1-p1 / transcript=MONOS_3749.1 / gene=MONOS_3749 / organism=Monocercomonoides_exilis_PA203 / gene_product=unspecified product / transcript_product=unspecified product / location=Mono_scaffold00091:65747-66395(+) / protein_length=183 / sequence_SO=supercontig / SO=protein_coding / is_pseudo=false